MCFKKILLMSAVAGVIATAAQPGFAQSFTDALAAAYNNNPTLLASRAALRATDENVPQALSGWRPTVNLTGEVARLRQDYDPSTASTPSDTITPKTLSLSVAQPLYRGGRTVAATDTAEALVLAGRHAHRQHRLPPGRVAPVPAYFRTS